MPHVDARVRALCNGRSELHSPPRSYGGTKRLISEVYRPISNYLAKDINFLGCRSRAVNTFGHHDRYEVKGLKSAKKKILRYNVKGDATTCEEFGQLRYNAGRIIKNGGHHAFPR